MGTQLFHVNMLRNSILRAARAWVSPALVTPNAVLGNQCVHDPGVMPWSGGSDAPHERADPRIAEGFRGTKRSHGAGLRAVTSNLAPHLSHSARARSKQGLLGLARQQSLAGRGR